MYKQIDTNTKKRNLSDVSSASTISPVVAPKKVIKMNTDQNFELNAEWSEIPDDSSTNKDHVQEERLISVLKSTSTNPTLENKVDEILAFLKAQAVKTDLDITILQAENKALHLKVQESEGSISRLTSRVKSLEQKLEDVQIYSMKSNLIFYNIPEKPDEDIYEVMSRFIRETMGIQEDLLFSKKNPSGEIRVDISHRIGQKGRGDGKPRPIIVKFLSHRGRDIVLSYAKALKATPFAVSEQIPPSAREKRSAQIPVMIEMRERAKQEKSDVNIRLVRDKLIVNSKVTTENLEKNPIDYTTSTGQPISYANMQHSMTTTTKGSIFQGHYYPIHSEGEAVQSLRALLQNDLTSKSDHIIYAYNYGGEDGQIVTGHCDDGEWGASSILCELLKQRNISNAILVVTRKYGGTNLGKQRFQIIKQVACNVLDLPFP